KECASKTYPSVTVNTYLPAVTNFKANADVNSVKLTWDKVTGAQGYIIYKYDTAKKSYVRVTKTTNTNNSYTVSGLNAGTSNKFAIKAYKTIDGKECASKTYPSVTVNTYLPAVTNFKASADINSVKLTWDKVTGAQGYVVYWYDTAKKSYVRVTKTTTNVNTYTVKNLASGTSYKYAIRAYKTVDGKEVLSTTYPSLSCKLV
ncbi:MAG: fibronectin type III domain-containing protein, partial [Ruminococcus sp.]|nr:fibronectin type III domain-containing protein [Ruminococcus sp.]